MYVNAVWKEVGLVPAHSEIGIHKKRGLITFRQPQLWQAET